MYQESMSNNTYDTGDFIELLLAHLVRDPIVRKKAREAGLLPTDLITSDDYGIRVYEKIAEIALSIKDPIVSISLMIIKVEELFQAEQLTKQQAPLVHDLLLFIYKTELTPEYIADQLKLFVKYRRQEKIKTLYADDNDRMLVELNKTHIEFVKETVSAKTTTVRPFEAPVKKSIVAMVRTGFNRIDQIMGGLSYGEYGLLIGYSGGGKTAFGTNLCSNAALLGHKATYISLEETIEDISNRFYSKFFEISYTRLHNGSGYMELESAFQEERHQSHLRLLSENLCIEGMKGLTPLTVDDLKAVLDRNYETTGFIPEVVVVDQLQFLSPRSDGESHQTWEKERKSSKECDELSHMQIGGQNFALWVQHQAKGKNKKYFTTEEIDGFKGIIQPADTVLGIGREKPNSEDFAIFSLKSRHSKNFELDYKGNLEFMRFSDSNSEPMAQPGFAINSNPTAPAIPPPEQLGSNPIP